jgi:hypothetical protein
MHKSCLAGFIIDCQTDNLHCAATFWSGALGMRAGAVSGVSGQYIQLDHDKPHLHIEVQAVAHESRVHLDIETDNIEAEVQRLEALGAQRVAYLNGWWVMQAPTGQRFCVVRAQSAHFEQRANTWP